MLRLGATVRGAARLAPRVSLQPAICARTYASGAPQARGAGRGRFWALALACLAGGGATAYLVLEALDERPGRTAAGGDQGGSAFVQLPPTERRLPLHTVYAWGSNLYVRAAVRAHADLARNLVAAPQSPSTSRVARPQRVPAFDGVALRDMQLAETYGVAVDVNGDVVQWGTGFATAPGSPQLPRKTLTGMDIVRVQLTPRKVYALARSGDVYVFSASETEQERTKSTPAPSWLGALAPWSRTPNIACAKLSCADPASGRSSSERFTDIAAGEHHVLALSRRGRVWAVPVDEQANAYGQLGQTQVTLNARGSSGEPKAETARLEPLAARRGEALPTAASGELLAPSSVWYATTLQPVPALRDVGVAQIAAGSEHSLVRTTEGRVLAWGRNNLGQLGLGTSTSAEAVAVPSEVTLPTSVVGRSATCTAIAAGAVNSFFVVQSAQRAGAAAGTDGAVPPAERGSPTRVDLLACGGGQRSTLGSGQRNQVCSTPVRVKNVSGLQEYDEAHAQLRPVGVHAVSVGTSGQCAVVLDAPSMGEETRRDVYVWGANDACQLGTGKRSSLAVPAVLTAVDEASGLDGRSSPVLNRLLLVERTGGKTLGFSTGGPGKHRSVRSAEQAIAAGGSSMALYTRVAV